MQCAAVAAAATGDSKNVDYQEFTIATILKNLKDGVIDIAAAGATHTMERQVYVVSMPCSRKTEICYYLYCTRNKGYFVFTVSHHL